MRVPNRFRLSSLALGTIATGIVACGAPQGVTTEELVLLQNRVVQLEREAGSSRVQIEEMEERIFLLQDRVDAARVTAGRRHDAEYVRSVVTIGAGSSRPPQALNAAAPPPFPQVDPLAVPSLPVQRIGPAASGAAAPTSADPFAEAWDAEPEVVITNETLAARYGSEPDASFGASRTTARSAGSARVAQPPVDVGSATLSVVPLPQQGTRAAAPVAAPTPVPVSSSTSARASYDRALDQFNNGQYAEALQSLTTFVDSAPAPDYMDNALFWMGECYYGLGRYNDALGYFQRVVSEYPDGNKVPDSLLKVALSYERLNNVASAREVLSVVTDTYPSTDAARRARERLQSIQ